MLPNDPRPTKAPVKTALLVEDEHSTLRFYLTGLRGLHEFTLLSAENGAQALAILEQRTVDVLVTDLNMPVMDGYSLIAVLGDRYPALPIIVITSVSDQVQHDKVIELGALRVITKPPKLSSLMEVIRAAAQIPPPGMVRGLGLPSLLQLMEWEQRSATLTVRSADRVGYLYVKDGALIHAAHEGEKGLIAAYRMLCWDGIQVEFVSRCRVKPTIDLPLQEILLNLAAFLDTAAPAPEAPAPPPPAEAPPAPIALDERSLGDDRWARD